MSIPATGETIAQYTTLRLGGPARRSVTATTTDELVSAVRAADTEQEPVLLVGGGSNLVVGDEGWPGTVVLIRNRDVTVTRGEGAVEVTVAAGEPWDELVARCVAESWTGLAAMSGIPGLTGATPVQNVGAYGTEVADVITELTVYDRATGEVERWPAGRCSFAFRSSAFKHNDRWMVLDVTLRLRSGTDSVPVRYAELAKRLGVELNATAPEKDVRDAVLQLRAGKGMLLDGDDHDTWSVGSFFVNPIVEPSLAPPDCPRWPVGENVKLSAAWLIEHAGFSKGFGLDLDGGRVAVSTKHTLALTNRGGATASELLTLARVIRDGVEEEFGLRLGPEARLANCAIGG